MKQFIHLIFFLPSEPYLQEIYRTLARFHLFKLQNFHYELGALFVQCIGHCIHFHYTPIEIRKGAFNHLRAKLASNDCDALYSIRKKLIIDVLANLHKVNDVDTYLHKLYISSFNSYGSSILGLWGDTFFIKWFHKWLLIPIFVWLFETGKPYLCFHVKKPTYVYNLLFHNQNASCGHFEPLLAFKSKVIVQSSLQPFVPFFFHQESFFWGMDMHSIQQSLSEQ